MRAGTAVNLNNCNRPVEHSGGVLTGDEFLRVWFSKPQHAKNLDVQFADLEGRCRLRDMKTE